MALASEKLSGDAPTSLLAGRSLQVTFLMKGVIAPKNGKMGRKLPSIPNTLPIPAGATRINLINDGILAALWGARVTFGNDIDHSSNHCYYELQFTPEAYALENRQSFAVSSAETLASETDAGDKWVVLNVDHPRVRAIICHFKAGEREITLNDLRSELYSVRVAN